MRLSNHLRYPLLFALLVGMASIALAKPEERKPTLQLSTTHPQINEAVDVTFTAPAGLPADAFIVVVQAYVNPDDAALNIQQKVEFQRLGGRTTGTMGFNVRYNAERAYDVRMFSSETRGKLLAEASYVLNENNIYGTITLPKRVFKPGERIALSYEVSDPPEQKAWIGIVESSVSHFHGDSERYVTAGTNRFHYLYGHQKGTLTFLAPETPGRYDFRMYAWDDTVAPELAFIHFYVRK